MVELSSALDDDLAMGFNRRKPEDQRRETAAKVAASRRATDAQVLEDAQRLIAAWNERQGRRMPMLFSPTIGAAIAAQYWLVWIRCPACRTINAIDLRVLDRHPDAAISSLIPVLSCRSCRPNPPFAELVRLSRTSIAHETGRTPSSCAGRITRGASFQRHARKSAGVREGSILLGRS